MVVAAIQQMRGVAAVRVTFSDTISSAIHAHYEHRYHHQYAPEGSHSVAILPQFVQKKSNPGHIRHGRYFYGCFLLPPQPTATKWQDVTISAANDWLRRVYRLSPQSCLLGEHHCEYY